METVVIVALITGITGIIGGVGGSLFAQWANWGIKKRELRLNNQREFIAKWRKMIQKTRLQYEKEECDLPYIELLEREEDFPSLKGHLSSGVWKEISKSDHRDGTISITMIGNRVKVNSPDAIIEILFNEITRLERRWELVQPLKSIEQETKGRQLEHVIPNTKIDSVKQNISPHNETVKNLELNPATPPEITRTMKNKVDTLVERVDKLES